MIHNEGGLNEMLLGKFLKEKAENIALLMARLIFNMVLVRKSSCFFKG